MIPQRNFQMTKTMSNNQIKMSVAKSSSFCESMTFCQSTAIISWNDSRRFKSEADFSRENDLGEASDCLRAKLSPRDGLNLKAVALIKNLIVFDSHVFK